MGDPRSEMSNSDAQFLLQFLQGEELKFDGIPVTDHVSVGRHPDSTIVLHHATISRHHATFLLDSTTRPPGVILRDEGSTNGCIINGRTLKKQSVRVAPSDRIQIGAFRVRLVEAQDALDLTQDFSDQVTQSVFETSLSGPATLPDKRLHVLNEFAACLARLEGKDLLQAAGEAIAQCLEFEVLYMSLERDTGGPLILARTPSAPCAPGEIAVSRTLIRRCQTKSVAILADDSTKEIKPGDDDTSVFSSLKSAICVPLLHGQVNHGVIYASSPSETTYTKEDLQLLILIASQVTHKTVMDKALRVIRGEKEKLETILNSLREGVLLTDARFNVVTANPAVLEIFDGKSIIGKRIDQALADFQHNLDFEALPALTEFVIQRVNVDTGAGQDSRAIPKVYAATVSRNMGAHDTSWTYAICFHDISQNKQLEKMKSIFLNRLAHKLNTPLTVIMATHSLVATQLMAQLDPEMKSLLADSQQHVEQCATLVRQFIDYTSYGFSDMSAIKSTRHPLEELVDEAMRRSADLIAERKFRVVKAFTSDTVTVFGEREKLELAFSHIIQNAVKFGKPEGSLLIGPTKEKNMLKITFLDDGPGIPAGEIDNLGQLFYQVDPQNTGEVPGTGFGLWLVRQIIQSHGGELKITSPASSEGTGMMVEVVLPGALKQHSRSGAGTQTIAMGT